MSNESTYNGNPNLKPIGFEIQYTAEQVKEILKCSGDPIYFIENYCYIVSLDKGLIPFKLYDCQKEKVDIILNNRKVILMEGRQQGKTITAAACILWYTLFQSNKNVAILANKSSAAREVLHRYQIMYESLPIWMQQGVKTWNKGDVELENGSQVFTAATSASAIRGKSCVAGNTKVCIENNNSYYYVEIDKIINNSNFLNSNKDAIMKYTVYKTTNNENNKEYIGFHSLKDTESILCECTVTGSIFSDGYLGSGKLIKEAIHKYGPEKFRQELLGVFDKKEDAEEYEKKLVNNDYIKMESNYNIVTGGNVTILAGEKNPFYGKNHTLESIEKIKQTRFKNNLPTYQVKIKHLKNNKIYKGYLQLFDDLDIKHSRLEVYRLVYENEIEILDEKLNKLALEKYNEYLKWQASKPDRKKKLSENISLRLTGKPQTQEQVNKRTKSYKDWIHNNPEKHKERMDKINKNPEKIKKTAEKHRGMKRSEETRLKISNAIKELPSSTKGKIRKINSITGVVKYFSKDEHIPIEYIASSCNKPGRSSYTIDGKTFKMFFPEEVPIGWYKQGSPKKKKI